MRQYKLWIVCPCYYDVSSFLKLRETTRHVFENGKIPPPTFVLIDDSAGQDLMVATQVVPLENVQIITPPYNLGSQAAIVFALRKLSTVIDASDYIVTMDADGEDKPDDILPLIKPLTEKADDLHLISVARRTSRSVTLKFKLLYAGFILLFQILTGLIIRSGNFVAFRGWFLKEIIFHPHFDQCYASNFRSLPLNLAMVPIARGPRYFGHSKMGYFNLIGHGIRMLMPFTEKIAIRGLIVSSVLLILTLFGLLLSLALSMRDGHVLTSVFIFAGLSAFLIIVILNFFTLFVMFSQNKAISLRHLHERR